MRHSVDRCHLHYTPAAVGTGHLIYACAQAQLDVIVLPRARRLCISAPSVRPDWLLQRRDEGLLAFWKGNVPQLLRIFPYSAAQLTANDQYKRLLAGWAAGSRSGSSADADQVRSVGWEM